MRKREKERGGKYIEKVENGGRGVHKEEKAWKKSKRERGVED